MNEDNIKYFVSFNGYENEVTKEAYIKTENYIGSFTYVGEVCFKEFCVIDRGIEIKGRTNCAQYDGEF